MALITENVTEAIPVSAAFQAGLSQEVVFKDWTRRISRGDEAAFTEFHALYSLRLYKYLIVISQGREDQAREVLQTAMVKAAAKFKPFDSESHLWAWLCRLARNSYIDLCRSRRRESQFESVETAGEVTPDEVADAGLSTALSAALRNLDASDQEMLEAVYIDGVALKQIAAETGQSYKAVESRLGRLKVKVRAQILNFLRHEN